MAPTLGLREVADVSAEVTTTENSQALQMSSSANGGNGDTRRVSAPHEQQNEHDVVSHSHENLQARGEEQRLAGTTQRRTNTTQTHQADATQSPHLLVLSELLRVEREQEDERARVCEEIKQTRAQVKLMMTANEEMAAHQERMAAQFQASREASRAQMQAALSQFSQIHDCQRKSREQAQKTLEELEKMKGEFSMKVDETVREKLREAVDEELKKLPKVIKKEIKKEAKREKNKEEKAAGKPKKPLSLYNIHVMEEKKRLIASGSGEDLFLVASISWKEMDEEERWERYGGIYQLDKERYERELEVWWEKREVPDDQRKPAAKLTTEELDATTDPQQSVADDPNATSSFPEESAPAAAAMGPDNNDEGYQRSEYEQQVQENIARNQERLIRLGLLPRTGVEMENGGFLTRSGASNSSSKRGKKKKRKNRRGHSVGAGSVGTDGRRNAQENTTDLVGDLDDQGFTHSEANGKEGRNVQRSSQPSSGNSVAAAAATAENLPEAAVDTPAGVTKTQEESIRMPGLSAPGEAEATLTLKEAAIAFVEERISPPQPMQQAPSAPQRAPVAPSVGGWQSDKDIGDRRKMIAKIVQLLRQRKPNAPQEWLKKLPALAKRLEESLYRSAPSLDAYNDIKTVKQRLQQLAFTIGTKARRMQLAVPGTSPFERNSEKEPPHVEETRRSGFAAPSRLQTSTASSTNNGDGNAQESSSVTICRQRGKKRKNDSPYWYKNFPVYELEDYTDGTPLPPGYVWVEYSSGVVVKVKEVELGKELTARNPRRKLKHNLFSARATPREAGGSSGNVTEAQTASLSETIYVDSLRRSENASEIPFPVGYRFYHYVSGGSYHAGYKCVAEVKEVIGDDDGEFTSPNSVRRCYYFDVNDGSKRGEGNPLVKTIEKRKAYKN